MIFRYRPDDSWFHRLDPLTKFVWLACVSILSIRYENALGQTVLLLAVALFGVFAAGLSLRSIWRGIRFPFWFGLPYFALQLLFVPGETALARLGPLVLTEEAFQYATAVSVRLLTLVLASFVFVATTDPRDVVLALAQKLGVPYRFAFAVSIALRFLPILEAEADIIRAAQKRRGLGEPTGLGNRLAQQKRFALAVFAGAVRRVQQTAEAMDLRGFGAYRERTYRRTLRVPPAGIALSVVSVLLTAGLLLWF